MTDSQEYPGAAFAWTTALTVANMVALSLELGWAAASPDAHGLWGVFFLQALVNGGVLATPPRTRAIGQGILAGTLVAFLGWFAFLMFAAGPLD